MKLYITDLSVFFFFFSFVFLQLYHSTHFSNVDNDAKPILLPPSDSVIQRGLQNLDWIPPYELHKVAALIFKI